MPYACSTSRTRSLSTSLLVFFSLAGHLHRRPFIGRYLSEWDSVDGRLCDETEVRSETSDGAQWMRYSLTFSSTKETASQSDYSHTTRFDPSGRAIDTRGIHESNGRTARTAATTRDNSIEFRHGRSGHHGSICFLYGGETRPGGYQSWTDDSRSEGREDDDQRVRDN